ncbi:hypothetical protein [Emergencia timonensis]|uniref:hypothetical protein n=1 Tax=Emergencia timonensis TaxID=1776384 RepID=UPI0039F62958
MINYNTVQEIIDAGITNMECLRNNSSQDDGTDTILGADWLTYNGNVCANIYVSGNSWVGLGTSTEHLKVNRRDTKMWYLYREEGTLYGQFNFIKMRWGGYSYYNQTSDSYKLTYDVVLFSNGVIMLHMIDIPTSSNDGAYSLTSDAVYNYTVSLEQPDVTFYATDKGYNAINEVAVIDKLFDIKYLIKDYDTSEKFVTYTKVDSLWLNASNMTKDTGQAVAYTFPLVPGMKYTFECITIGNRLRTGTTATDPVTLQAGQSARLIRSFGVIDNPVLPQKIEFTANANEKYFVAHMSADGISPEVSIRSRSEYALYTVNMEGALTMLDTLEVSPQVFMDHGTDGLPPSESIKTLKNFSVLCWQDSEKQPSLRAEISATPPAQTVITDFISLEDETILGVESVTVTDTGAPLYALSFDNKATWEAWTGMSWATLDSETAGMSKGALQSIAIDQWAEKVDMLELTGFHMKLILHAGDSLESVVVDFVN